MACSICDHTMQCVSTGIFWCPRCGTIQNDTVFVPMLIERCREFYALLPLPSVSGDVGKLWRRLGIEESINVPENRVGVA